MWKKIKYTLVGDIVVQIVSTLVIFVATVIPFYFKSDWEAIFINLLFARVSAWQIMLFFLIITPAYIYYLKTRFKRKNIGEYTYIELVDILESEKTEVTGGKIQDENLLLIFIAMYSSGALSRPVSTFDQEETNLWAYKAGMRLDAYGLVKKQEVRDPKLNSRNGVEYSFSEDGKKFYAMIRKRNLYNAKNQMKYEKIKKAFRPAV